MNKSTLKTYAPQARRDFIDMVTSRAAQLGIAEHNGELKVESSLVQGEVVVIAGQAFPVNIERLRKKLLERIRQQGFSQTMEAIAYTWFNRFAALRYMELHEYLEHGQRVLSSVSVGGLPDILTHALDLAEAGELPAISRDMVAELKLNNKDGELYKRLLVAQCNKLATAMPFLFEKIDDDTELLLPDTLLRTDSVIRKLVDGIAEEDWQQVEVIGWLYQFYISEKKDQVIGKVVKSEDIPAATQLFTPNWIVKYLVQNSVGRLWLMANPHSGLAAQMAYYIQPAEQTPDVQAQLDALIKVRVAEDGDTLKPESITVLDPACGSGHILVEAYDLLKEIYLERGYKQRDIPRLILKHNLFGLDIDDRAAQLAGFALLMKARADDRRLFDNTPVLNVLAIQNSKGLDDELMADVVMQAAVKLEGGEVLGNRDLFGGGALATEHSSGLKAADLRELIRFFECGKTFGSLLTVPVALVEKLPKLEVLLAQVIAQGDSLAKSYAVQIWGDYLQPALVLAQRYDAVVANPPYMGSGGMNATLKEFAKKKYPDSKSDLFAMFTEKNIKLLKVNSFTAMITMPSWLFLSSFTEFREKIIKNHRIESMLHLGRGIFGIDFGSVAFVIQKNNLISQTSKFFRLHERVFQHIYFDDIAKIFKNSLKDKGYRYDFKKYRDSDGINSIPDGSDPEGLQIYFEANQDDFKKIPASPIAYWVSERVLDAFEDNSELRSVAISAGRIKTHNDSRYVRFFWELPVDTIGANARWLHYEKGGEFRKWYGCRLTVVDWSDEAKGYYASMGGLNNPKLRGLEGVTWGQITSGGSSFRQKGAEAENSSASPTLFVKETVKIAPLALLNSKPAIFLLKLLSPTLNANPGEILSIPVPNVQWPLEITNRILITAASDWDSYEISWDFTRLPILSTPHKQTSLAASYTTTRAHWQHMTHEMQRLEQENNRIFIDAYGLQDELTPEVPLKEITLTCNPHYRYGGDNSPEQLEQRLQTDTCKELVSYAIGNMMGRYSLNRDGLVYAHAGNQGFNELVQAGAYQRFAADADGILPVTDISWFADDAANRIKEFLIAVWGQNTLNENLLWLADSLGRKADETPEEAIRRYLVSSFYKDHLQTYKKRPIYWLFSSGKHKAFEALVYLHRYNEGTLSRMRTEYVVPLTGKMNDRIRFLETEVPKATSTAERKKLEKDIDRLKKKLDELRLYDEKLRHYADHRIALDLDDGVKVNYGKFGDLLAEVKAVTGGSDE